MTRVALTGGIGSGKSTVAALLRDLGCVVIDADEVARQVVRPGSDGLSEVVAEFGDGVLSDTGELDRAALGQVVFGEPERRQRLEAILHPRIAARTAQIMDALPAEACVVYDVPLLAESGRRGEWDVVVVVDCPDDVRLHRLVNERGMSRIDAERRMSAQASREQRLAVADVVIDNAGTREALAQQVGDLFAHLTRAARD